MSLLPQYCEESLNTRTEFYIIDETGAYTINNTGGYGTPNPNRSSFALAIVCFFRPFNKDKVRIMPLSQEIYYSPSYGNEEKTKFTLPYLKDGHHDIYLMLIPTTPATSTEGDIFYDTGSSVVRIKSGDNFIVVEDLATIIESTAITITFFPRILLGNSILSYKDVAEKTLDDVVNPSVKADKNRMYLMSSAIRDAHDIFYSGNRTEAQRILEQIIEPDNVM